MKVLTAEMVVKGFDWSKNLGDDYVKYDGKHLRYNHPETTSFAVAFPKTVGQIPWFVRFLATLGYDEREFTGADIWLTDAGIGNEFLEGIGSQILESMNTAAGQPMSFWEGRGYHLRADEFVKALGILIQPILFGWDAYYLPNWNIGGCSEYFLQVHHHECVFITTKSRAFHDKAIKSLVESKIELLSSDGMISRYLSAANLPRT